MTDRLNGPGATAPSGWYDDPKTGQSRYWDGARWATEGPPASPIARIESSELLMARGLRRQAWWRLLAAIATGSTVAIIILMSTTSTVIWWGGYLVAASLAWGALKRFRLAGDLTGAGVGAGPWTAMTAGIGLVALLAFQAASYWSTPYEPGPDEYAGTCWKDSGGTQVEPVDCGSTEAQYQVTSITTDVDTCSNWYLALDDGTYACMRDL